MTTSTTQPRRLYLFSHPRTMSNLLMRILETHPDLSQRSYSFFSAYFIGPERQAAPPREVYSYMPGYNEWEKKTYQKGLEECMEFIRGAEEKGKLPLLKDHANEFTSPTIPLDSMPPRPTVTDLRLDLPTTASAETSDIPNPTFLPSRFLLTFTPIFIIRHPANVAPSFLRATSSTTKSPEFPTCCAYKNQVMIFDFYRSQGVEPVVIDGGRLVSDAKRVMEEMCRRVGLDESVLKYEWEAKEVPKVFVGTPMDAFSG
ncbi:hypothetical protein MPER_09720, partial [Moniliophthora perniciosa FA553]